jgi:hypothetical protein
MPDGEMTSRRGNRDLRSGWAARDLLAQASALDLNGQNRLHDVAKLPEGCGVSLHADGRVLMPNGFEAITVEACQWGHASGEMTELV